MSSIATQPLWVLVLLSVCKSKKAQVKWEAGASPALPLQQLARKMLATRHCEYLYSWEGGDLLLSASFERASLETSP